MKEYEIQYNNGEIDFLYAHNASELAERYPNIPRETYKILSWDYID